jgi:hypothetical protein
MSAATSGDEPRGMNTIDYYQTEVAYRREQMLGDQGSLRRWLRSRRTAATAAPKNRTR